MQFVGLDLYSLGRSIRAIIEYLEKHDPELARVAKKRYGCLEPWVQTPEKYGLDALMRGFGKCEANVVKMLREILERRLGEAGDDWLDVEMNARLVRDAEEYYRAMYYGGEVSWNLRDTHMFETLVRVLRAKERESGPVKAVVWAHNSHLGDARYTGMGMHRHEINIGQV